MKKVIVIGSGGAGKSTFSRRLGKLTGLPVIHLDSLFWRPNWNPTPKDEWFETVKELLKADAWIMDGNFGGTRELRIAACDTIIYLEMPRRVCLYRVLKRMVMYYGKTRPDMGKGCDEKIDVEFIGWVWNYRNKSRPRVMEQITRHKDKRVVILSSKNEVEQFLRTCDI